MIPAVIGRFVLEVALASEEDAREAEAGLLQGLTQDRLASLLEECVADFPASMGPVSIDRLEIDLGRVALSLPADELYAKAKAAITEQLTALFTDPEGGTLAAGTRVSLEALEVLAGFLRRGTLHWAVGGDRPVAALVREAAAADAAGTAALLQRALADPAAARRLVDHLPEGDLSGITTAVTHTSAPSLADWLTELRGVFIRLQRDQPFTDRPLSMVEIAVGQVSLQIATDTAARQIGMSRIAERFVTGVAAHLGLDAEALRAGVATRLRLGGQGDAGSPRLAAVLARGDGSSSGEAGQADQADQLAGPDGQEAEPRGYENWPLPFDGPDPALRAVAAFLQTGAVTGRMRSRLAHSAGVGGVSGAGEPISEAAVRRALRYWLQGGAGAGAARAEITSILRRNGGSAAILQRLRQLLPQPEASAFIRWLGPAAALVEDAERLLPLEQVVGRPETTAAATDGPAGDRALALFWYVVEYGALPWWGREVADGSIDAWTATLVEERADALVQALRDAPEHRRALLIERMTDRLAAEPLAAIAAAANPAMAQGMARWLGRAGELAVGIRAFLAEQGAAAEAEAAKQTQVRQVPGMTAVSAHKVLHALAALLLGRLLDPHAPQLEWPEMQRELAGAAFRRLGVPPEALEGLAAGLEPDVEPAAADPLEGELALATADASARDLELIGRFVSPTLQLSVEVEEISAILVDEARRQAVSERLGVAELDALAERLAPGEPALRAGVLGSLADILPVEGGASSAESWGSMVSAQVLEALSWRVRGETGGAATARGALRMLLQRQAAKDGRPYAGFIQAIAAAVAAVAGDARQAAVADLLRTLAAELPEAPPAERSGGGQGQALPEVHRLGAPGSARIDEPALLRAFLAMPQTAPDWQHTNRLMQQVLAEPVRLAALVARAPVAQLDALVERLGAPGPKLLPSVLPVLAGMIEAIAPGAGSRAWVQDRIGEVLGGLASSAAGGGAGLTVELRRMLLRLARDEGLNYGQLMQDLDAAAEQIAGAARRDLGLAFKELAGSAEAYIPVAERAEAGLALVPVPAAGRAVEAFLTGVQGGEQGLRRVLSDPLARSALASASEVPLIDQLAKAMIQTDDGVLPRDLVDLGVMVSAAAPGVSAEAWRVLVLSRVLAHLNALGAEGGSAAWYEMALADAVRTAAEASAIPVQALAAAMLADTVGDEHGGDEHGGDEANAGASMPNALAAVLAEIAWSDDLPRPLEHANAPVSGGEEIASTAPATEDAGELVFVERLLAALLPDFEAEAFRRNIVRHLLRQTMVVAQQAALPSLAGVRVNPGDVVLAALREAAAASEMPLPGLLQAVLRRPGWPRHPVADRVRETLRPFAASPPSENAAGEALEPARDGWQWKAGDEQPAARPGDLIFVQDAGIILLWPFLTHYFDRVGLLEDGKFPTEDAAARAVMLIHYMATGDTETEEPRLTLPKILCGVPFETPVHPRITLTDLEQTVSEELLNVVCQNWPPLRNTSAGGLRETFLLREGSLSWMEEQIWVLNVAAKPFDMLLGQLPWTISTFKTAQMEHPMMVQWGQS